MKRKAEEARQRELEQAQQLAKAERQRAEYQTRSNRIFRILAAVMAALLLLSLWAGRRAVEAQEAAGRQETLATVAATTAKQKAKEAEAARRQAERARLATEIERQKADESAIEASKALEEKRAALENVEKAFAEVKVQKQAAEEAYQRLQALTNEAYNEPQVSRASNRTITRSKELKLDQRTRPLRLGASIGTPLGGTGSLCCVVRDRAGLKYLLSLGSVFAGEPGTPILQPAQTDGGTLETDKVAVLMRVGQGSLKAQSFVVRIKPVLRELDVELVEQ